MDVFVTPIYPVVFDKIGVHNISVYTISTRNTSLTGYLTIPALSFGSNIYIKYFSNLMSNSQIQLQCNNGNVFGTGNTTLTMNTNNQSVHIYSAEVEHMAPC